MLTAYTVKAKDVARRSALAAVGAVLSLVGLGFLTHAFWLVLSEIRDPIFAAQVLGGLFLLLGGGLLLLSRRKRVVAVPPRPAVTGAVLAEAFLVGMDAAQSSRRRG